MPRISAGLLMYRIKDGATLFDVGLTLIVTTIGLFVQIGKGTLAPWSPTQRLVVVGRIWWILRYWGLDDVRLLNGGWKGWTSADLPLETDKPEPPTPTKFAAIPKSKRLVAKQQVLDALKDRRLQIVDARSEKEFCGIDAMKNKRAEAIPGAKHLEWSDLLDQQTRRFKSPEQIRKLFEDAAIDLKKPTATRCQSGGRASVMAFGMELMGAPDVGNYYAGWGEWGNAEDTPIVPGEAKKQ